VDNNVNWIKSSRSNGNGDCVEVALAPEGSDDVLVRDSKDPEGPMLRFPRQVWWEFLDGAHNYEFDF
jgi:hypothetical protein